MPGCILQDVSFWGQAPLVQGVITSAWHSCVKVRDVVRHFFLQPLEASQLIEGSSKVTSFCWTHPLSTTHIFSVSIFLGVKLEVGSPGSSLEGYHSQQRAEHIPASLQTHMVPYLGEDRQAVQTADGRELNPDWGRTLAPQNCDLFLATRSWKALRYQWSLLIHHWVLSKLVIRLMFTVVQHLAWIETQNVVARICFSSSLDHFADPLACVQWSD